MRLNEVDITIIAPNHKALSYNARPRIRLCRSGLINPVFLAIFLK
jgi:hypothetical protein